MDNVELLTVAMAEKCRSVIQAWDEQETDLPAPLRRQHLIAMCNQIENNAEDWSPAKLQRWVGFVQCAIIANRILDLNDVKTMFDDAKVAYGDVDEDFFDHLDPNSAFEVDIGGEG